MRSNAALATPKLSCSRWNKDQRTQTKLGDSNITQANLALMNGPKYRDAEPVRVECFPYGATIPNCKTRKVGIERSDTALAILSNPLSSDESNMLVRSLASIQSKRGCPKQELAGCAAAMLLCCCLPTPEIVGMSQEFPGSPSRSAGRPATTHSRSTDCQVERLSAWPPDPRSASASASASCIECIMASSLPLFFLLAISGLFVCAFSFQSPAQLRSSRLISPTRARTSLVVSPLQAATSSTSSSDVPPTRAAASSNKNADSAATRAKRTSAFTDWATSNGIQVGGVSVSGGDVAEGLGLVTTRDVKPGDVVVTVPTNVVLSVTSPGEYNRGARELFGDKNVYRDAPWWAQLSVQLNRFDKVNSVDLESGIDMRGWLDSLPRAFDTPIHWSDDTLKEIQYPYLSNSIASQKRQWYAQYQQIMKGLGSSSPLQSMTFPDFVWGAENARSRAFSGSYGGSAFNPLPYGLTVVLVAAYVGLGIGSLEQAANGAALVICGSILKDFVFPKLSKVQKYIICPFIDMSNHKGIGERGDVAFEYFGDAYSLSIKNGPVSKGEELFISYGPRSNDQLLKYYGFVEQNNPHDVYIMPQLREWDIAALETACGRQFSAGRLAKLDKAGLLGFSGGSTAEDNDDDDAANMGGGVVVSRAGGVDGAIMQALRALVASDEEWDDAGEAIGNFAAEGSGGPQTERLARLAARTALEMELASKPTTIEEDKELLKRMDSKAMDVSVEEKLAVLFRIEKKKLLQETIDRLA